MSIVRLDAGTFHLARYNEDIRAAAGGNGLTKKSGGKEPFVLEFPGTVNHDNVQITGEREMLKSVVQEKNVDRLLRLDSMAFSITIFADSERDPALETMLHHLDFVTRAARTTVATAENRHALAFLEEFFGEPQHHWRLSGAPHSQIANANHLAAQTLLL